MYDLGSDFPVGVGFCKEGVGRQHQLVVRHSSSRISGVSAQNLNYENPTPILQVNHPCKGPNPRSLLSREAQDAATLQKYQLSQSKFEDASLGGVQKSARVCERPG